LVDGVISANETAYTKKFENKRKNINQRYATTGGSPLTADLIAAWPSWRWIRGKDLISHIRDGVRNNWLKDEKLVGKGSEGFAIATDLLSTLASKLG